MNREDLTKVAIFALAAIMIGGMFYGIQFNQQNNNALPPGTVVNGMTVFNGTLRTYEPFLVVGSNVSDSVIAGLRTDERVKAVTSEVGGYLINTTTRDDVFPLAEYLNSQGISSNTLADVIMPTDIEVKLANGTEINASTVLLGSVKVIAEPLVDTDSDVSVRMIAMVQGGDLVSYSSATMLSGSVLVPVNATVLSLEGKKYGFVVPWSERAAVDEKSLDASYGAGNVAFDRNDYISFPGGLGVVQIAEKKNLPYITFITDTGASVNESFADESRVMNDFGNITVVFPDSGLSIVTNSTVNLSYNGTVLYSYLVELPQEAGGYSIPGGSVTLDTGREYAANDSVSVVVNGTTIGSRMVRINSAVAG